MSIDHTTGTHESVEAAISFIPSGTTHASREFSSRRLGVKMPFGDYLPPRKRGRGLTTLYLCSSQLFFLRSRSGFLVALLVLETRLRLRETSLRLIKVGVIMFVAVQTTGVINQALAKVTAVKSAVCGDVRTSSIPPTSTELPPVPHRLGR